MVIADTTGRPLFQIAAPPTSRAFDWWPETDQMVFLTTDDDWPQGRSRTGERATRYSVVVVNYRTGRRVTATFDSRDIRALVTAATPQGELRRP